MIRPEHLPDFAEPPLDELVIGVQFAPAPGYSSVHSKDIWKLYSNEFPTVEEHHPIEPKFETFGGSNPQPGLQFKFGPAQIRGRLWLISKDQNHLIQFQDDRFLLNWRKRPNGQDYPRFEGIAASFKAHLEQLSRHFSAEFSHSIEINQIEVSYINIIPVEEYSQIGDWLSLFGDIQLKIEGLTTNLIEVVTDIDGKPIARLNYEIQSVVTTDGKIKAIKLSLTFRGSPTGTTLSESMSMIEIARDNIVTRFGEITTQKAQKFWKKKS